MPAVLLKQPAPPPDFEAFWQAVVAESDALPLIYERVHQPEDDTPSHHIYRLRWRGADGKGREGWYAVPAAFQNKPLPGLLYLPGYGINAVSINENTAFSRFITLAPNLHGYAVEPSIPYSPEYGYFTQGIESPQTYVYRRLMLDSILAARVLAAQPEVDSHRLIAAGLSQGGGLAVMLGAWCSLVRVVVAELPALTYWEYLLDATVWRYPIKEFADYMQATGHSKEALLATLQYFDTVNHAPLVRVPVQLSLALKDPGIRPPVVFSLYDALPRPKRLLIYEDLGHDWSPEMHIRLQEWVEQHL
ncbi:Cephalosporin-C deacetylase [bacterium HR15]|nr:Cephalosporin-C deacetylase [bacterium HR15]